MKRKWFILGWFTSLVSTGLLTPVQGIDPSGRDPNASHYAPGTLGDIEYRKAREQKLKELGKEDPLFQNFYKREFLKKEKKKK